MKRILKSFLILSLLAFFLAPVSEARTIGEHVKLAKNGVFNIVPNGMSPVTVSSNGQVVTGVLITTSPVAGMLTALFDTNMIEDEPAGACMFDVYTPPATTQFYDFTGLGTGLGGSTQGTSQIAGTFSSQINASNGITLLAWRGDGGTTNGGSVIIYTDN